jgi:hypothetical protein
MWMIEESGEAIYAWDGGNNHRTFGLEEGWTPVVDYESPTGHDLLRDENDHLWLVTNQDVRRFDGERWTVYTRQDLGMAPPVADELFQQFKLAYSAVSHTIWVGACDWGGPGPFGGGGVRWFDGSAWHGADSPVAEGCATEIEETENGRIWTAVDDSLWRFDPADGHWEQFVPPVLPEGIRIGYAEELLLDPQGDPWPLFSLCGGASCGNGYVRYHLQDGVWTQIGDLDPNGIAYFLENEQFSFYKLQHPIEFDQLRVVAAVMDENNNLWLVARPSSDLPLAIWHALMNG